jgi:membrane protein implicated in regulation of membrane protease activity
MTPIFVTCAALGGTILICQTLLMLLGIGAESLHGDLGGGLDHFGAGDLHSDLGGGDHDAAGHDGGHAGADQQDDDHAAADHHQVARLFGMLSFRTIVAALTFFGLAGLAAQSAHASTSTVLLVAVAAGLAALYGVFYLVQTLYSLRQEGNVRMDRAVGRQASVYLKIPGHNAGSGKIQIDLQNRTMEYLAMTGGETIQTGARVVVVGILSPTTVAVEAISN